MCVARRYDDTIELSFPFCEPSTFVYTLGKPTEDRNEEKKMKLFSRLIGMKCSMCDRSMGQLFVLSELCDVIGGRKFTGNVHKNSRFFSLSVSVSQSVVSYVLPIHFATPCVHTVYAHAHCLCIRLCCYAVHFSRIVELFS